MGHTLCSKFYVTGGGHWQVKLGCLSSYRLARIFARNRAVNGRCMLYSVSPDTRFEKLSTSLVCSTEVVVRSGPVRVRVHWRT